MFHSGKFKSRHGLCISYFNEIKEIKIAPSSLLAARFPPPRPCCSLPSFASHLDSEIFCFFPNGFPWFPFSKRFVPTEADLSVSLYAQYLNTDGVVRTNCYLRIVQLECVIEAHHHLRYIVSSYMWQCIKLLLPELVGFSKREGVFRPSEAQYNQSLASTFINPCNLRRRLN